MIHVVVRNFVSWSASFRFSFVLKCGHTAIERGLRLHFGKLFDRMLSSIGLLAY